LYLVSHKEQLLGKPRGVLGCADMDIFLSEMNKNEGQPDMQNRKESIWKTTSHFLYLLH
jgi:hypothetical protein